MTTTALIEAPIVTPEQVKLVKDTIAAGATDTELKLFMYDCQRQGVHPLDRLVHFTKRAGKYTPITSIDFMRIRAAETNEYAGSDDAVFTMLNVRENEAPVSATVTVWRLVQGTRCAFTATARWSEYKPEQNDFMWKRMPHTMLAKCAEALALRKGFPRQLAGLYAKEEMDQAGVATGYTVEAPAPTGVREKPAARLVEEAGTSSTTQFDPTQQATDGLGNKFPPSDEGPDLGVDLPPGAKLIVQVELRKGGAEARIRFHTGEEHLTYKPQIAALAEQLCQDRTPIFPDLKKSATGNFYIVGLAPIPSSYEPPAPLVPLTDRDIPF